MNSNKKLFCFQCKKCIGNQQSSHCNSCNQNYHLQCFNNNSNNNSFKKWACLNCAEAENIFPFQSLNNSDFSGLFATNTNHNSNIHNAKKLNKLFTNMHSKVFNAVPTFILDNESYINTKDAALLFKNLNENSFSTMCINIRSLLNPNNFNKL